MQLESIDQLNQTQQIFVDWNAERLDISAEASFQRLKKSWNTIDGGYGGGLFREFNVKCHDVFQVLYGDNANEVIGAYHHFAPLHFLRMLSYPEPNINPNSLMMSGLEDLDHVTILDFGCGLAQASRAIAKHLAGAGKSVKLFLVDIPTIRKDFLLDLCKKTDIDASFLECSTEKPIPFLPVHNLCIATEFFEHVYDPVKYFHAIDDKLLVGGNLVTNTANHNREFMHVCPNLEQLRAAISEKDYHAIKADRIFRKLSG